MAPIRGKKSEAGGSEGVFETIDLGNMGKARMRVFLIPCDMLLYMKVPSAFCSVRFRERGVLSVLCMCASARTVWEGAGCFWVGMTAWTTGVMGTCVSKKKNSGGPPTGLLFVLSVLCILAAALGLLLVDGRGTCESGAVIERHAVTGPLGCW